jgi:hypothetical protein
VKTAEGTDSCVPPEPFALKLVWILMAAVLLLAGGCGGSLNSGNPQSRLRALDRVSDEGELRKFALMHPDPAIREKAVIRVKDQDALSYAARCDSDALVRLAAVGRVSDCETISVVAIADEDLRVRLAALERTTNQDTLVHVAVGDSRSVVRAAALRKITDDRRIAEVAPVLLIGTGSEPFIPWEDQSNLLERIHDQSMLEHLMWHGCNERVSGLAAMRLTNKAAVMHAEWKPWNALHAKELSRAIEVRKER